MKNIRLTYSVVTEESAQYGDHARHGFVTRNKTIPDRTYLPKRPAEFTLREAIAFCQEHGGSIQADCCPVTLGCPPRWFDFCREDISNGRSATGNATLSITVALHLPRNVTPSSAMRLARYLGCYGVR